MITSISRDDTAGAAKARLSNLVFWYRNLARKVLSKQQQNDKIAALDADAEHLLIQGGKLNHKVSICFLGNSGVGKSTLINAVVAGADIVVPSGGVGPLTARELKIEYGEERALTAIYHEPRKLWRLVFALEKMFAHELATYKENEPDDLGDSIAEEDKADAELTDPAENHFGMSKGETYRKLGCLIITGSQDADVDTPYIVDSLRDAIGKSRRYGTVVRQDDVSRLQRLRRIFRGGEPNEPSCFECSGDADSFLTAIRDHATGYLAPLVAEFICQWNCELLRNRTELVDLPGLGVAGDVYRKVTDEWIRKKAQVVVLVVDSRGIRESDAELLRTSGFLARLLHAADDPAADPVSLVVAVVKIDDIADSRRQEDKSKKKIDHFLQVQEETKGLLHNQLRQSLLTAWVDRRDPTRDEVKEAVIERLVTGTAVFPLSAIQHRRFLSEDDDPPFISSEEQSGVPAFKTGLMHAAGRQHDERARKLAERLALFDSEVCSILKLIQARLGDSNATSEQAIRIKRELELFLQPLREEMRVRQGQFRTYLKDTLPSRIEILILEAREAAGKDIKKQVRKLRDVHWATIRAAVRRGGTYNGSRQIELPRDFSQAFEEPIAEIWGKRILKDVRQNTRDYADDCGELVKRAVEWGRDHSELIRPEVLEAQLAAIKIDAQKLATIGREMVNELREKVLERLLKAIEDPIRKKCQAFVRRNADVGTGVKLRMLELLDQLCEDSLEVAVPEAKAILLENYQEMEREIRKAFENYHDPLKTVSETIGEQFVTHDEAESLRRRESLAELDECLKQRPVFAETNSSR